MLCGISTSFPVLSPCIRQVTYALLTRPPLELQEQAPIIPVRLACVKHAASVRPEPGSNSAHDKNDLEWMSLGGEIGRAHV